LLNISRLNLGQLEVNPQTANIDAFSNAPKLLKQAKPQNVRAAGKKISTNHTDKSTVLPPDKTLLPRR